MNIQTTERERPAMPEPGELVIPEATLPEFVLGQARRRGDKPALIDPGSERRMSYAELAASVRQIGTALAARGVRPGEVLALCAPNSIEFVATWYAATSIGAIVTMVNPVWTGEEIAQQLRLSGATRLVSTAELYVQKLKEAADRCESSRAT